jgi:hypothetical protein
VSTNYLSSDFKCSFVFCILYTFALGSLLKAYLNESYFYTGLTELRNYKFDWTVKLPLLLYWTDYTLILLTTAGIGIGFYRGVSTILTDDCAFELWTWVELTTVEIDLSYPMIDILSAFSFDLPLIVLYSQSSTEFFYFTSSVLLFFVLSGKRSWSKSCFVNVKLTIIKSIIFVIV